MDRVATPKNRAKAMDDAKDNDNTKKNIDDNNEHDNLRKKQIIQKGLFGRKTRNINSDKNAHRHRQRKNKVEIDLGPLLEGETTTPPPTSSSSRRRIHGDSNNDEINSLLGNRNVVIDDDRRNSRRKKNSNSDVFYSNNNKEAEETDDMLACSIQTVTLKKMFLKIQYDEIHNANSDCTSDDDSCTSSTDDEKDDIISVDIEHVDYKVMKEVLYKLKSKFDINVLPPNYSDKDSTDKSFYTNKDAKFANNRRNNNPSICDSDDGDLFSIGNSSVNREIQALTAELGFNNSVNSINQEDIKALAAEFTPLAKELKDWNHDKENDTGDNKSGTNTDMLDCSMNKELNNLSEAEKLLQYKLAIFHYFSASFEYDE